MKASWGPADVDTVPGVFSAIGYFGIMGAMSKRKWYAPQLERAVLRALFYEAKARHVPMTVLASALLKGALRNKPGRERAHLAKKSGARFIDEEFGPYLPRSLFVNYCSRLSTVTALNGSFFPV
jgi:hypothetical protein